MQSSFVLALVRHILTFVGGAAVARGYMDDASMQQIVGAVVTLISLGWSLLDKRAAATSQ